MMCRLILNSLVIFSLLFSPLSVAEQGDKNWYAAIGSGVSKLTPDMGNSNYEITNNSDSSLGIALGLDVNKRTSVEFTAARLGDAALSDDRFVSYTTVGASALYHFLGNSNSIATRRGLWGYARLGINRLDYSGSDVELSAQTSTAMQIGGGVEWNLLRNWSVRTEFTRFDKDAQTVGVSLLWRSRGASSATVSSNPENPAATESNPAVVASGANLPTPNPTKTDSDVATPTVAAQPVALPEPALPNSDLDSSAGDCAVPAPAEPLDSKGCAVFSGISMIDFVDDTSELTSAGRSALEQVASNLMKYNAIKLEIAAHASVSEGAQAALSLSRQRVLAVAQSLVKLGVPVSRLQARAFGDTQPRLDNDSPLAMRLNNRIVFNVLP